MKPVASRRTLDLASLLLCATTVALAAPANPQCPQTTSGLYQRIRSVALDPQRVYRIRDASIDRPNLYIDLDDGTVAFTEDICGQITGAFFEGEGELRLRPPNRVERGSMSLFTGMAILEEQFTSAYLRFNNHTAADLQKFLSPAAEPAEFVKEWSSTSRALAEFDALRLLLDFSHFLPSADPMGQRESPPVPAQADANIPSSARKPESTPTQNFPALLHAHFLGKKLGAFEVFWDAAAYEPLSAGQPRLKDDALFFDIWTSFAPVGAPSRNPIPDAAITDFRIRAAVQPPTTLRASTDLKVRIRSGGQRTLIFELSRYLKLDSVATAGHPLDFIQNPAIEGSQLQRKGNDLVAVVFPAPLATGQELNLRFTYAGDVLSEAGIGLLYVGERGTWYPSFGPSPAQFDMEFHYPFAWTLLATGKQVSPARSDATQSPDPPVAEKVSRWISERPIPVAGFNLGKYVRAEAKIGNTLVEAYGTKGVEKSFPKARPEITQETFPGAKARTMAPIVVVPPPPSPAHDVQAVADKAARAIGNFSQWFGPYPYSSLALTQMPGDLSQGWPGLVFLSSFAFLNPQEQSDLHIDSVTRELASQVLVHETAHQWWGDLILWKSYRDQWISEGLANYASLMILEQQNPAQFREVLEKYRRDLEASNKDGELLRDAGPVTLGQRLISSHFPNGYDAISYERGTWLFHMLRCMLRDAAAHDPKSIARTKKARITSPANSEEPFFRILRKIRDRYAGKSLSTQDLIQAFEEDLPRPLWYEKRPKLDWFLDGWIEGTSIPELEASEVHISTKLGATTVYGVIVQKDAPDDLVTAIPVYGETDSNSLIFLGEVLADGHQTAFHLTAPTPVHKIVLDPRQTLLSKLK